MINPDGMIEFITNRFKKKKQKCRTGPDCGWNMKPNHCDVFYNCKFNEVDMRLKTEHDFELEKLELHRKELDFKIIELRNRIKAEEMEAEQSPAEPTPFEIWKNSDPKHTWWPWWFNPTPTVSWNCWREEQTKAQSGAFEAGQKHGAGVEREKYTNILDFVEGFVCRYNTQKHITHAQVIDFCEVFERELKNLESDTEPEQGELPEKPSWVERLREKKQTAKVTIYDDGSMDIDGDVYVKMPSVTFT